MNRDEILLQQLRIDPDGIVRQVRGFVVGESDALLAGRDEGGRCRLECVSRADGFHEIKPSSSRPGIDYFFPYVSVGLGGVGWCDVPHGQVQPGSIVLTGGMNGCGLEVREVGAALRFIHDANGKALQHKAPDHAGRAGCRRLRLDHGDYMSDADSNPSGMQIPVHYLISVKTETGWTVLHTPVFLEAGPRSQVYRLIPGREARKLTAF